MRIVIMPISIKRHGNHFEFFDPMIITNPLEIICCYLRVEFAIFLSSKRAITLK